MDRRYRQADGRLNQTNQEVRMGGVDVGTGGGKRALNKEINMIPFIDFLLVTVAFLLITAVWINFSRMEVDARQPGATTGPVDPGHLSKDLHIHAREADFALTWKQGSTIISETRVPRPEMSPGEQPQYQDLADKIAEEWKRHGGHQDPSDGHRDRCVLHTDNAMPFGEVVAVMDAIYEAKRDSRLDNGKLQKVPAFVMAFASR